MRKILGFLVVFTVSLMILGCGGPQKVSDKEMTLSLSYGDRSGTYTGEVNEQGVPNGKGKFTTKNSKANPGSTKEILRTVILKERGVPCGRMTSKKNPATTQMIG